jgi:AraC-like DNA-binding protein
MDQLPVYQIDTFKHAQRAAMFYANVLPKHLEEHGFVNKIHGHNFYLTVFFTAGFGVHEVDFKRYAIVPGSLFTLKPGQVHLWRLSRNIDGHIFFHSGDFFDLLYNERSPLTKSDFFLNRKDPSIWLDKQSQTLLTPLFARLTTEYTKSSPLKMEKVCALAFLIYLELSDLDQKEAVGEETNLHYFHKTRHLEKLINDHYKTLKFPSQYADHMHMTPKHLNRISKHTLGITVTQLITQRIVLEGKRLLVNPKYSVANIAEILGYDDPSYFTKVFKKSTGMSPHNFRNT